MCAARVQESQASALRSGVIVQRIGDIKWKALSSFSGSVKYYC